MNPSDAEKWAELVKSNPVFWVVALYVGSHVLGALKDLATTVDKAAQSIKSLVTRIRNRDEPSPEVDAPGYQGPERRTCLLDPKTQDNLAGLYRNSKRADERLEDVQRRLDHIEVSEEEILRIGREASANYARGAVHLENASRALAEVERETQRIAVKVGVG